MEILCVFKRYEIKIYTYYLFSISRSRGYESFHDAIGSLHRMSSAQVLDTSMTRAPVTCTNKVNFLIFCLLTTVISHIMKEEIINQPKRMRKEEA